MKISRSDLLPAQPAAEQPQTMKDFAETHRAAQRDKVTKGRALNDAQRRSYDPEEFDRVERFHGRN